MGPGCCHESFIQLSNNLPNVMLCLAAIIRECILFYKYIMYNTNNNLVQINL